MHGVYIASYVNMPLGHTARRQSLNDDVSRAFASAGITARKEPSGLVRGDGKHQDGLILVPWQSGKPLTWDLTVVHTLADSYVSQTSRSDRRSS